MTSKSILIFGVGNDGSQYEGTRHNLGYRVVSSFGDYISVQFSKNKKCGGWLAQKILDKVNVNLLLPATFVNLSGDVVKSSMELLGVDIKDILVVVDDVNIPLGSLRYRKTGSSGGHNGLSSIEDSLGTDAYSRLRIGISRDDNISLENYVLSRFTLDQLFLVHLVVRKSVLVIRYWIEGLFDEMRVLISSPLEGIS